MESEVAWLPLPHQDAHSLFSLATVFVSATALQEHLRTPKAESAEAALQTASAALPTPSAMPAMLDSTLAKEFVLLQPLPAPQVSSDTTESATLNALREPANKETSARGLALLEHGPSTADATEPAQPN